MTSQMNPALLERLQAVAREATAAGHGHKNAVYQAAANEIGVSVPTLHRKLKEVTMTKQRKRRTDAGKTALTIEEARIISGYLTETQRANGKRLSSIENALEVLRSNGRIIAARLDEDTGELRPLSTSAVSRGLQIYGLHPEQQGRPTPKMMLASKHPNHVWQIDPSLCVLYYLPQSNGLQVMDEKKFYKNKPANIRKIEKERVWRYVITDHASGVIFVHYVLGAESGKNLVEAFVNATQRRHENDPFHGVPLMAMVDPGSANTGAIFQNLCRALGVHVQVNVPGQPWAKGQVEKANDTVEREFEHRLRFFENAPTTVEEINDYAWRWMRWFNQAKTHSRTGKSRYSVWLTIKPEQLRVAPPAAVMRELAYSQPETRVVTAQLTIKFGGHEFNVADVPDVMVGEKLLVTRNPWRDKDSAQVMYKNEEGREVIHIIEALTVDEYGFADTAVEIGSEYRRHGDTRIDTERKNVERLVMEASTDQEAADARKRKKTPFSGAIDAMKPIDDTPLPDYINKRGTAMDIASPTVEIKPLSHVDAAKLLATRLGEQWQGAEHFAWLQQHYPDGIGEEQLGAIEQQLTQPRATVVGGSLRLLKVKGGA